MNAAVSAETDKIEAMAAVMIDTFGVRALSIAQTQVEAAVPDQPSVADTWKQIVDLIRNRLPPQPEATGLF